MSLDKKEKIPERIRAMEREICDFDFPLNLEKALMFRWEDVKFSISEFVKNENVYQYDSYEEAEQAAIEAVRNAVYPELPRLLRDIIKCYGKCRLEPYICYAENEKNFYYAVNKKAERLLRKMLSEFYLLFPTEKISGDWCKINVHPALENSWHVHVLKDGIQDFADVIFRESGMQEYFLSHFEPGYEIHEIERYDDEIGDLEKGVKKYAFTIETWTFEVINEELQWACSETFDDCIVKTMVYGCVKFITENYIHLLRNYLHDKYEDLLSFASISAALVLEDI